MPAPYGSAFVPSFTDPPSPFAAEAPPSEPAYALVPQRPEVPSGECELSNVSAVEVRVRWGENVLFVTHLSPPRSFVLGESDADFVIPAERLGSSRMPILVVEDGLPRVLVPSGARVTGSGLPANTACAASIPLGDAGRVSLELGDLVIELSAVAAGKPCARTLFGDADRASAAYFGLSLLSHAAILASLAFFAPPIGVTDDESIDAQRLITIQQYLDSAAERERDRELASASEDQPAGSGESGEAARGESGAMGRPFAERVHKRSAVAGPPDNPDPQLQRIQTIRDAQNFGIIGILAADSGDARALAVPWGRDPWLGTDPSSAVGSMWGDDIGDSAGSGGLGLTGIGEGGGGPGEGIGLARVGTCGSAICGGMGHSVANRPGAHRPVTPLVRQLPPKTSGVLPPEVIQRVVRQNFGRFRLCYEDGLRKNPNLEGRVTTRFVIGRDGAVSNVSNGGSDLPDSSVVSCVISAYYGLSFPAPDNGIVTVVYPIAFSPGG
jgi:hypothetical protein